MQNPPYAIVTGGSAGIGAAICRNLIDQGYQVLSLARRAAAFTHPSVTSIAVDLSDCQQTAEVAQSLAEQYPIRTVVHNAGIVREQLLPEVSLENLHTLQNLHINAAVSLVQASLPGMREAGFGRIVLISSRAALGLAKRTAYSASKAGMIGMARTWALELGEYGITSNVVAPGPIAETEMFDEVIEPGSPKIATIEKGIPVKRLGKPEDVANAVGFLVKPESGFVTGQTLFVCGGTSIGSISY